MAGTYKLTVDVPKPNNVIIGQNLTVSGTASYTPPISPSLSATTELRILPQETQVLVSVSGIGSKTIGTNLTAWSVTFDVPLAGPRTITAEAGDKRISFDVSIRTETTVPLVSIEYPADGQEIPASTLGEQLVIGGSVRDVGSGIKNVKWQLDQNGYVDLGISTEPGEARTYSIGLTVANLAKNVTHSISVCATDKSENQHTLSRRFSIIQDEQDVDIVIGNSTVLLFPVRLETRFKSNQLLVRIYPDDILIRKHNPGLTEEEYNAADEWKKDQASTNIEDRKNAWSALVEKVGRARAAYLNELIEFGRLEKPAQWSTNWEQSPYFDMLPRRFRIALYNGENLVKTQDGKAIVEPVHLFAQSENQSQFGEQADWLYDYEVAEDKGLAITIYVAGVQFDRVIAVGIRNSEDESEQSLLTRLFNDHRYTSGWGYLPHGTPTNNTDNTDSGYSRLEGDSYQIEFPTSSDQGSSATYASVLANALKLDPKSLQRVQGGFDSFSDDGSQLRSVIWLALGDYFINTMISPALSPSCRQVLWMFFEKFVQARDILPSIRMGKQPYGIVPVTQISGYQISSEDLGNNFTGESRNTAISFLPKLHALVNKLCTEWLECATDRNLVPHIGRSPNEDPSGDIDEELMQILAMQPSSIDTQISALVDHRFITWINNVCGQSFWGDNVDLKQKWWEIASNRSSDARTFLTEIAAILQVDSTELLGSFILDLFGWDESTPLSVPLVAGDTEESKPNHYLHHFNEIPPLDHNKPMLYDLFRRAIAYQKQKGSRIRVPGTMPAETIKNIGAGRVTQIVQRNSPVVENELLVELELDGSEQILAPEAGSIGNIEVKVGQDVEERALLLIFLPDSGTTAGAVSIQIKAPYAARIKNLRVNERDHVEAGTLLLSICKVEQQRAPEDGMVAETNVTVGMHVSAGSNLLSFRPYRYADNIVGNIANLIKNKPITELTDYTRDALDLHTHRLDAWVTAFPAMRMKSLQEKSDYKVHIGAYGWVENLKKGASTAEGRQGGYIHAPSLGQAAAGAVLRNAYLSHLEEDGADENTPNSSETFRINLSSRRVRQAWRLLDGIRQGQELGALLGYQFERGLHDIGQDAYIDNFRTIAPLVEQETEPDSGHALDTIAARNVVDGLTLSREWEQYQETHEVELGNRWKNALNVTPDELSEDLKDQLNTLNDTLDAVTDLLLYEGVYHEVQGNYEHAAAAMDAMSGEGPPPAEPLSIQTPANGVSFKQRIGLLFNSVTPPTGDTIGPRTEAEPTLARWFAGILGSTSQIGCYAELIEFRNQDNEVLSDAIVNINQATAAELTKLVDLNTTLATAIIEERENGFYRNPQDLLRVSGMDEERVEVLTPYISFDRLDINRATVEELQSLVGVNEEVANTIVTSRTTGRYYLNLSELVSREILDISEFDRVKSRLMITLLDLNTATIQELKLRTGVNDMEAASIAQDREHGGPFTSLSNLQDRLNGRPPPLRVNVIDKLQGLVSVRTPLKISFDNLGIDAFDFLYLSQSVPVAISTALGFQKPSTIAMQAGETQLETRINYFFCKQNRLDPNCKIAIHFYQATPGFSRSIGEAVELARYTMDAISDRSCLSPQNLHRPEDAHGELSHQWDITQLKARLETSANRFSSLQSRLLENRADYSDIYQDLTRFGIVTALLSSPIRDSAPNRLTIVRKTVTERINTYTEHNSKALKAEADANTAQGKEEQRSLMNTAIKELVSAFRALFGDNFIVLPILTPVDDTLENVSNNSINLVPQGYERIRLWLQQVAQVHPPVERLENAMLTGAVWQQTRITADTNCTATTVDDYEPVRLQVLQFPVDDTGKRRWLALSDSERIDEQLAEQRERGIMSMVVAAPTVPQLKYREPITGLLIDEWDEWLPSPTVHTGVTFHYDRPNAQAPQALLLAVPPVKDSDAIWTEDLLLNIVKDTMDLAKIRAVDLDALNSKLGRLFPMTLMPPDPQKSVLNLQRPASFPYPVWLFNASR